jgi:hypothetical protein
MPNEELARARHLIEQKRYHEARAILQGLDSPTAKLWLARLDTKLPASKPKKSMRSIGLAVLLIAIVVVGGALLATLDTQRRAAELQMQVINGTMAQETESYLETSTMTYLMQTANAVYATEVILTTTAILEQYSTVSAQLEGSTTTRWEGIYGSQTAFWATIDEEERRSPGFGASFCGRLGTPPEACRYQR